MSYKPEESTLVSYLYGELTGDEKKKVEEYLSHSQDARRELDEMKEVLGIMRHAKDREVEAPVFSFGSPSKVIVDSKDRGIWWRYPLGIAASLALLMVVGYFTSFNVSSADGELIVSFGDQKDIQGEMFTREEVKEMITLALGENNKLVNQQIENTKDNLLTKVSQQPPVKVDQQLLDEYIQRLRQFNASTMAGLLEESEQEQRRYTDQIVQDLAIFMDLQRQDDLELIQSRIENLSEDTRRFNQRTGQIITSLLSDETQNENQY